LAAIDIDGGFIIGATAGRLVGARFRTKGFPQETGFVWLNSRTLAATPISEVSAQRLKVKESKQVISEAGQIFSCNVKSILSTAKQEQGFFFLLNSAESTAEFLIKGLVL
jgi:hypothetical protein